MKKESGTQEIRKETEKSSYLSLFLIHFG